VTRTTVHSVRELSGARTVEEGWLTFDDGVVLSTGRGVPPPALPGETVIDGAGRLLSAGLVDIHLHGGGGVSAEDGPESISRMLATHRAHGTTRSTVSFVSASTTRTAPWLREVAAIVSADARVLGSHLEGPFLAPDHRGAHDPAQLRSPDPRTIEELLDAAGGTLRMVTLAPELPGAGAAIDRLVAAGIVVAIGHTSAGYEEARAAFDRGASVLTHAFNGMAGLHHRAPGPVLAAIRAGHVTLEVIADGLHVHPEMIALLFAEAPGRVALISDAMAAAGAGDGHYLLGERRVEVLGGQARLEGGESLAGSTLTLDLAVSYAIKECGIDPAEAVAAATRVPAAALGLSARLAPARGAVADVVLWSDELRVDRVWLAGQPFVSV
jgi:N-acetylglucosamine-6-phosphate deacetylase